MQVIGSKVKILQGKYQGEEGTITRYDISPCGRLGMLGIKLDNGKDIAMNERIGNRTFKENWEKYLTPSQGGTSKEGEHGV